MTKNIATTDPTSEDKHQQTSKNRLHEDPNRTIKNNDKYPTILQMSGVRILLVTTPTNFKMREMNKFSLNRIMFKRQTQNVLIAVASTPSATGGASSSHRSREQTLIAEQPNQQTKRIYTRRD